MSCYGCYKKNITGYCLECRKKLFGGARVSHILPFDEPTAENLPGYQERTKRLSISGVQLKYSLRLEGNQLQLTDKGGQHILKPIPPSRQIIETSQAPENEHLTMQIAEQLFDIPTAANALILFADGAPAYITKRFDVKADGTKYLQEDMAQLSGKSRQTHGENFKYDGTYEDVGKLIRQFVPAYLPALETYFRLVLFNYIFSNGDAHLKNFSVIQSEMGDYALTPAYDLMSTVLHTPNEIETALDLYHSDLDHEFYARFGNFGQPHFRELAKRLGILPVRAVRIITQLLSGKDAVTGLIGGSFLTDEVKTKYESAYCEKINRLGMTGEMIARIMNPKYPGIYAPTTAATKLIFRNGSIKMGYFQPVSIFKELQAENKYSFVEFANAGNYRNSHDEKYVTIVEGDLLAGVEYPVG